MLAYILGITNSCRFQGIQIVARKIANMGSLRDFKSGQKVFKSWQRSPMGESEIANRDRGFKSGQRL